MKQILIINGHPYRESFNHALTDSYVKGASTTHAQISQINIGDLKFNPNLQFGFSERTELEPGLLESIQKIKAADHIVWVFPIWWAGYPAIMKGFIDRIFLPGITFQPIDGKVLPKKLLKGKTSRIIITCDTPQWYNYLYMKNTINNIKLIMNFAFTEFYKEFIFILLSGLLIGFFNIKLFLYSLLEITYISPIKNSKVEFREKWLQKIHLLGKDLK